MPESPVTGLAIPEGASPSESPTDVQSPVGATRVQQGPIGATRVVEDPTLGQRIVRRFMGTDVEDPQEWPRLGTVVVGGLGGALAGSRVPVAPGPAGLFVNPVTGAFVGGATGVLAGAVAPEATLSTLESLGLVEPGTRQKKGLSPEELRTVAEGELLLDLATMGGITALRAGVRGAVRIRRGMKESDELAEAAARQGIDLMPVQVGDRTIARGFVAVMGRFPLVGGRFRAGGQATEQQFRGAIEAVPERIGPVTGMDSISHQIFSDASELLTEVNRVFSDRYTQLFARADEAGVKAVPRNTRAKGEEILENIRAETPATTTGDASPGGVLGKVQKFIEEDILTLGDAQTLRQMDGIISKIDQEIATLEPGQRRFAMSLLTQLRQAVQADVVTELRGPGADQIGRAMREVDTEFSQTIASLFETSVAKKFQSVQRRGIRGVSADEATRTPVDQLARLILRFDSPQSIDELARLVTPETMQRTVAQVFDDAVQGSMRHVEGGRAFDVDSFAKKLGIDRPTSAQFKTTERMLKHSGSDLSMKDLEDLVKAGRAIRDVEIPDVSTFLARAGVIGGVRSIFSNLLPGVAVAGGVGAIWGGAGLLSVAGFVGGSRLIAAMLTDPKVARPLRTVLSDEASTAAKKKAIVMAVRAGLQNLRDSGEIGQEMFHMSLDVLSQSVQEMEKFSTEQNIRPIGRVETQE